MLRSALAAAHSGRGKLILVSPFFLVVAEVLFMRLADILAHKGNKVYSIRPNSSLDEVVQMLVRHNIGSLMVCVEDDCRRMLGIITERDILRAAPRTAARSKRSKSPT